MHTVNMHEAKTKLSSLVEEAVTGEEVIIAKSGYPLVRLVPVQRDVRPRVPGRFKGLISLAEDFEQTPKEVINDFEGTAK